MNAMTPPTTRTLPLNPSPGPFPRETKQARRIAEARRLAREGKHDEALRVLQPLLHTSRPDAQSLFEAAAILAMSQRVDQALPLAIRSLAQVEHPDTLRLLAFCRTTMGDTDQALAACDRAEALDPGHHGTRCLRGNALEQGGRFDEALTVVEPLVHEIEECGQALDPKIGLLWAKILVQFKRNDEACEYIDRALADEGAGGEIRVALLHTKAKALDRSRDYAGAYAAARSANAIGELEFHPEIYEEQVTALIENWSRDQMARFPISSCASEVPVFVAGLPRSGTSLLDQIIDAHPRAAGVGELSSLDMFARQLSQAWDPDLEPPGSFGSFNSRRWTQAAERYVRSIQELSPGAERIVNKSLGNNRLVGLLARMFPKTRIIHAIRDPRDVAVSCFMGGFNNALFPWTARLEWVARAWEQSMRMMEHWKATLDVPILDVHYERLVTRPETEFPRIIEFLGLDWDDACNQFYRSRRTVRTLSYDQVNRPLYTSSAGRHTHYARFLEGIEFPEYDPYAHD